MINLQEQVKKAFCYQNCSDLSLFEQIALVISKILQILGLQHRISKILVLYLGLQMLLKKSCHSFLKTLSRDWLIWLHDSRLLLRNSAEFFLLFFSPTTLKGMEISRGQWLLVDTFFSNWVNSSGQFLRVNSRGHFLGEFYVVDTFWWW